MHFFLTISNVFFIFIPHKPNTSHPTKFQRKNTGVLFASLAKDFNQENGNLAVIIQQQQHSSRHIGTDT